MSDPKEKGKEDGDGWVKRGNHEEVVITKEIGFHLQVEAWRINWPIGVSWTSLL